MKITEIRFYPDNKENQAVRVSMVCGDFNLLQPMLKEYKKSLDKEKIPYFFEVQTIHGTDYEFNLNPDEFEFAKKFYQIEV